MADDYTFTGESASGSAKNATYNFTNKGTFAGIQIYKEEENVFYFASNRFISSIDLDANHKTNCRNYIFHFFIFFFFN